MRAVLNNMSQEIRAQKSGILVRQFLECSIYQTSRSLAVYVSMAQEPDTTGLLQTCLQDNKLVFTPQVLQRVLKPNYPTMCMRRLHSWEQLQSWKKNKWGIKEPSQPSDSKVLDEVIDEGGLDIIIIPGLAFSRDGDRLGRGGGYYDRYVKWYGEKVRELKIRQPKLIALVFEEQLVNHLPTEQHDIRVDSLITA